MLVRHLAAYDVAPETLDAFRAAIGDTLLPVQELAVREGLLGTREEERGQNLLIAAPTSTGKSFVGEMAAVHAAQAGKRVFYLVPLKAMAEEVYRGLQARYQRLGLRVAISTRDHRGFDDVILQRSTAQAQSGGGGECHIAVMVYEKLQSLLVACPELLDQVGLLIIDELQVLCDPTRGPRLELLLTKLRRAQRAAPIGATPQLLCLSAPMASLEELGAWLSAKVVIDERRPVELRAGVLHRGTLTYCSSRESRATPFPEEAPRLTEELHADPGPEVARDAAQALALAVQALCRRGEQTLVFFPDRARSLEGARALCDALLGLTSPAAQALEDIAGTDEGQARDALLQTLRCGVAFHNADLTQGQRDAIERAFRRGEIRALCATSTLAMGVNLPAKNVIIAERWKWRYSRRYNKWIRDNLTKLEYDSMSGRAGRLGLCDPVQSFGRSLLIAPSRFDAEVWLRTLVDAPVQELEPTLLGKPLGDVVLDLVASALVRDEAEVIDFILSTFTGYARWARQPGQQAFAQSVGMTIADLVRNDLLTRDEDSGALAVTGAGRVCARKGLMVRSVVMLARWSDAAAPLEVQFTPLEVLLVCALTPDGGEAHVPLSLPEHRFGDYWTRVLLKAQELGAADRRVFRWLRDQRGRLTYDQTKAVKKALLLLDWVDSHDSAALERDHCVWSGAVSHAAADFAWLVDALAELCDARGWPSERSQELQKLAERLRYGVADNLLPLARAVSRVLPRSHLQRVAQAGLTTEAALWQADEGALAKAVGDRGLLQKILQIRAAVLALQKKERAAAPAVAVEVAAPEPRGVVLPLRRPGAEAALEVPGVVEVPAVLETPEAGEARGAAPMLVVVRDEEAAGPKEAADAVTEDQQELAELAELERLAAQERLDTEDEPEQEARLSPAQRPRTPRGADLPLSQLLVDGSPLHPEAGAAETNASDAAELSLGPLFDGRGSTPRVGSLPRSAGQLPQLRPVLVRPRPAPAATPAIPSLPGMNPAAPTNDAQADAAMNNRGAAAALATDAAPARELPLVLTPDTGPRCCYLERGEQRVALSPGCFALLFHLALHREREDAGGLGRGWVASPALGTTHSGVRKGVSRLRKELRQLSSEARSWVENDGHGNYRLSLAAPAVVLDREALRQHPLATVRAALRAA